MPNYKFKYTLFRNSGYTIHKRKYGVKPVNFCGCATQVARHQKLKPWFWLATKEGNPNERSSRFPKTQTEASLHAQSPSLTPRRKIFHEKMSILF